MTCWSFSMPPVFTWALVSAGYWLEVKVLDGRRAHRFRRIGKDDGPEFKLTGDGYLLDHTRKG